MCMSRPAATEWSAADTAAAGSSGCHLMDQRAKLGLDAGVFVQEVSEPARPPVRRRLPSLLQAQARRRGLQLLASLGQPPLRGLGFTLSPRPSSRAIRPRNASHTSVTAAPPPSARQLRQRH